MSRTVRMVLVGALVVAAVVGAYVFGSGSARSNLTSSAGSGGSMGDARVPKAAEISSAEFVPAVKAYYEGDKLYFIHTEASDQKVADMLTKMMGPQVVVMPALAELPEKFLAKFYVFTNGVTGDGPFGFQPDIFDSVPGDDSYSPLRSINLVEWADEGQARELLAMGELRAAADAGEVTIKASGVVVNVPVIVWPGGRR